jgi:PGF-CTERM protein
MDVLGRDSGEDGDGVHGRFGRYLAADQSLGARVGVDFAGPHAGIVVGKRGSGKSYTLGVLAEGLAETTGVAPVVVDPMGAFGGLAAAGVPVVEPRVRASALPPRAWCELLDLDPAGSAGTLVWRAATEAETLDAMRAWVADAHATAAARRAAANHLELADSWGCFAPDAPTPMDLLADGAVLDGTGLETTALQAVVAAVAAGLYRAAVDGTGNLPWLLIADGVVVEATQTATATVTATATETATATDPSGESGGGIPGFGMGIALIAVLGAALLALRQN